MLSGPGYAMSRPQPEEQEGAHTGATTKSQPHTDLPRSDLQPGSFTAKGHGAGAPRLGASIRALRGRRKWQGRNEAQVGLFPDREERNSRVSRGPWDSFGFEHTTSCWLVGFLRPLPVLANGHPLAASLPGCPAPLYTQPYNLWCLSLCPNLLFL